MTIFRMIDSDGKPQFCNAARAWEHLHRRPEPGLTLQFFDYLSTNRMKGEWRDITPDDLPNAPLKVTRNLEAPKWSAKDFADGRVDKG